MKNYIIVFLFTSFFAIPTNSFAQKKLSNPEKEFELFWTTFKNNYAFFEYKKINWDSIYTEYRPSINKKTKQSELLNVFKQMVEPLKDGHITITKGEEVLYKGKKRSYFKEEFKGIEKTFWATVDQTLIGNDFSKPIGIGPIFREENLYYASQSENIGYIKITRCFGNIESVFDEKKEASDLLLMTKLFDSLLVNYKDKKGIIIDLRGNGGGHGGFELASRLAPEKKLTHYKATRKDGKLSALESIYIEPCKTSQFLKPVVILTSDRTASSAEDFTISLYQFNHITTIGSSTSGMLSDMYEANLNKKIAFTLSNQIYYSTSKEILEDKGIPAKIEILNSKKDIENGIDPVLIKAIGNFN